MELVSCRVALGCGVERQDAGEMAPGVGLVPISEGEPAAVGGKGLADLERDKRNGG